MGQLEPDHLQPPGRVLPPGILMPEDEVSAGPKGDRGDWAPGSQFSLIIPVLANVVLAVFGVLLETVRSSGSERVNF